MKIQNSFKKMKVSSVQIEAYIKRLINHDFYAK